MHVNCSINGAKFNQWVCHEVPQFKYFTSLLNVVLFKQLCNFYWIIFCFFSFVDSACFVHGSCLFFWPFMWHSLIFLYILFKSYLLICLFVVESLHNIVYFFLCFPHIYLSICLSISLSSPCNKQPLKKK